MKISMTDLNRKTILFITYEIYFKPGEMESGRDKYYVMPFHTKNYNYYFEKNEATKNRKYH